MEYWQQLLEEVLNKHDPVYPTFLTNVRERQQQTIADSHIKRKNLHTVKKHTQITGVVKQYKLGDLYPDIYFTKREAQIMYYFLEGKSTAEIALFLDLSGRTVEFYANNMKTKLGCHSKAELIYKVMRSDFLNAFNFMSTMR